MSYTERKKQGGSIYYYRARSFRENGEVKKKRVYLGKDLGEEELKRAEMEADKELDVLSSLLSDNEVLRLERLKERYEGSPRSTVHNRYEAFVSLFTHDSTAIEGNTLTLQETAALLFEGVSPTAKHMREIHEVLNHREAFDLVLSHEEDISKRFILELHELVIRNTLSPELADQAGRYRKVQVYIRGARWLPPSPKDVPREMMDLLRWYAFNRKKLHPLVLASCFHVQFETIHPFVDGNGRVGRLLLNFILRRNGFPMVNIPNAGKLRYYECLETGQAEGDLRPFVRFIYDLMTGSDLMF